MTRTAARGASAILAAALLPGLALAGGAPWPSGSIIHKPAQGSPFRPAVPPPLLQAAPWYLYWPYDAHFQTAAPIYAPYYPPHLLGAVPPQSFYPYFSPGYGAAGYGLNPQLNGMPGEAIYSGQPPQAPPAGVAPGVPASQSR
jgi:hypothetical protein